MRGKPDDVRRSGWTVLPRIVLAAMAVAGALAAAEGPPPAATRQLLVVAPGYWRAGDAGKFSFEVYDLEAGGKRIHRAEPGKVGEVRGLCFSPATQRLYVAGHEGMLCYSWPEKTLLWRKPVEGPKSEQNDAVTVTLDGTRLYTRRHFGKGMNVYDAMSGERLRVIHEDRMRGGRFSQVSHDGRRLYAMSEQGPGIDVLDPMTDAYVSFFKTLAHPIRFTLTSDGNRFIYATGSKRSLAIHATADGKLLSEVPVPDWDGVVKTDVFKGSIGWVAVSPGGRHAWACDHANRCLHRFDLAAEPPAYAGRVPLAQDSEALKDVQGLMYSVDGRFLVDGTGAMRAPADGTLVGHLTDEASKPVKASNNMIALETEATGRVLRTNQQCAPAWPAGAPNSPAKGEDVP